MPGVGDALIGGIKPVVTTALTGAFNISAKGPGALTALTVMNFDTGGGRMVLLLDQVASPAAFSATAVTPIWFWFLAAASSTVPTAVAADWTVAPLQFVNGLWVVLSTVLTTPFSCTTAGNVMAASATINLA